MWYLSRNNLYCFGLNLRRGQWTFFNICNWDEKNPNKSTVPLFKSTEVSNGIFFHIQLLPCCCKCVYVTILYNYSLLIRSIVLDYYMVFFIWHVISTRDSHVIPRAEGPRANMGRGLIWLVIWKMPYHNLFIIYFNAPFLIFVRADRFQKP